MLLARRLIPIRLGRPGGMIEVVILSVSNNRCPSVNGYFARYLRYNLIMP
jgi:hypothetical protein